MLGLNIVSSYLKFYQRRGIEVIPETQFTNTKKRSIQHHIFEHFIVECEANSVALCLPGVTGWDAWQLVHHEKISKIICIEENKEIANHLKNKFAEYPKVEVFHTSLQKYVATTEHNFGIVYLDFYSFFNHNIKVVLEVLAYREKISADTCLSVNFLSARETITDQIYQKLEVASLCEFLKIEIPKNKMHLRALAFNSFLLFLGKRTSVKFNAPKWFRYKSDKAWMLTMATTPSQISKWGTIKFTDKFFGGKKFTQQNLKEFSREHRIIMPGVTNGSLSYYLSPAERSIRIRNGLRRTKKKLGRPQLIDKILILKLRKEGLSLNKIATKTGYSKASCCRYARGFR